MNILNTVATDLMNSASQSIGVFDSGVGGLTVYRAIRQRLPNENIVYLGDTARIPYGTRSLSTVRRYALEDAAFLMTCDIKLLVVACNTASSIALDALRATLPIPVIGVIEPGAKRAARLTRTRRVGVIATEATVDSGAYTAAILSNRPGVTVIERGCPLLVPLAEEGWSTHEVARMVAEEYLRPLCDADIDTLVMGCTHYPILRDVIQNVVGDGVTLVDSGDCAAEEVVQLLNERGLAAPPDTPRRPTRFCVTDSGRRFRRIAEIFLGHPMDQPETVDLWEKNQVSGFW
jgi:glutamate racemase